MVHRVSIKPLLSGAMWMVPALAIAATVADFGAKGDGETDDTAAIQRAIDTCAAKGETLVFPAGTFMTGTIHLRSHSAIELTAKAVWKGIGRVDAYPMQTPRDFTGRTMREWRAWIYAEDVENISLRGSGTLDGNGGQPAFPKRPNGNDRPFGLWIIRCRDISVEGLRLINSAFWMQNYEECDHVRIRGIRVFNHANHNNDGLDLTDCRDVVVSDCEIDSSDDALCLKSHGERGAWDHVISNCVLASHADAFKMGTASRGGFRRITANNLVIRPSRADHIEHPLKMGSGLAGIDLMSTDGGTLEDIVIQNVVIDGVETPIVLKLGDRWARAQRAAEQNVTSSDGVPLSQRPGVVRNILISHVVARHAGPIPNLITGYPGHRVENITLSDILLECEGGAPAYGFTVKENSGNYPYNRIFGREIPAYAFFVRHVENIRLRNIQVRTLASDQRPAVIFNDATGSLQDVEFFNAGGPARPPIVVDRSEAIRLRGTSAALNVEVRTP